MPDGLQCMCIAGPPQIQVPAPPPTPQDAGVRAARAAALRRLSSAAGRASTILTGPAGVPGQTAPAGKQLLGM